MQLKKWIIVLNVLLLLGAAAHAQNMSSKGVSYLLNQQKAWQAQQLPKNAVLRKFDNTSFSGTGYYLGERDYNTNYWPFKGPVLPTIALPTATKAAQTPAMMFSASTTSSAKTNTHVPSPFLCELTLPITQEVLAKANWKF